MCIWDLKYVYVCGRNTYTSSVNFTYTQWFLDCVYAMFVLNVYVTFKIYVYVKNVFAYT